MSGEVHVPAIPSEQLPVSQVVSGIIAPDEFDRGSFSDTKTTNPDASPVATLRLVVRISGSPGVILPKSIEVFEIENENGVVEIVPPVPDVLELLVVTV